MSTQPRLLVVAQRYGDVAGGAEAHARMLVARLAPHLDVTVATTTARDYWTWEHVFPPGETRVDGVPVLRFPVLRRRARAFRWYQSRAFRGGHSLTDERAFIEAQGPYVPDLLEYLFDAGRCFDHVLFFTYIYYPTVYGLPLVPDRAVLVPTAHDEPALRLTSYRALFHAPRAIAFNTEEERALVHRVFANQRVPNDVLGVGVEIPDDVSGDRFRAKHGLEGPLLLYVGRIVESKGTHELLAYFSRWRDEGAGGATLVLAGQAEMRLPSRADVRHVGYLDDAEKFDAFAATDVFVLPSRLESLSIVALEAWASGKPVLSHAASDVLRGMSRRSGAGLFYGSYAEFAEVLDLLLADRELHARLGAAGRAFVARTHTWPRIVDTYLDLFAEVRARNA